MRPWLSLFLLLTACGELNEERTVAMASYLVPCEGVGPQLCYQIEDLADGQKTLLYQRVESFDFRWGADYILRIAIEPLTIPTDDSSVVYRLVELISQTPAMDRFTLNIESRFLSRTTDGGIQLLNTREIVCASESLCDQLSEATAADAPFALELAHPEDPDDPLTAHALR